MLIRIYNALYWRWVRLYRYITSIVEKVEELKLNYYKKKALVPFDENWFKDKRVAIIGGADSAYKEKLGDYIDSFDVVVRINNGVRVIDKYHEYVGRRTDFLFHSLYTKKDFGESPIEIDLWKESKVKLLIFSRSIDNNSYSKKYFTKFLKISKGRYKISSIKFKQSESNFKLVFPTNPTTGISTINTILNCNPKIIYLTGITFFKTPHLKDYREIIEENYIIMKENHNPDIEYNAFKEIYLRNKKVFELDKTLQLIIDQN